MGTTQIETQRLRVDPLLDAREVATMLGVSRAYVYLHSTGGKVPVIPHVPIGGAVRFRRSSVEKFVQDLERVA